MSTEKTNPFESGVDNPGTDETGEQMEMRNLNPYYSSTSSSSRSTIISRHRTDEETSFGGDTTDTTPLIALEENVDATWEIIQKKFPNANKVNSSFTARVDEYGRVMGRLNTNKGKYLLFKKDGKLNDKLPQKIKISWPTS